MGILPAICSQCRQLYVTSSAPLPGLEISPLMLPTSRLSAARCLRHPQIPRREIPPAQPCGRSAWICHSHHLQQHYRLPTPILRRDHRHRRHCTHCHRRRSRWYYDERRPRQFCGLRWLPSVWVAVWASSSVWVAVWAWPWASRRGYALWTQPSSSTAQSLACGSSRTERLRSRAEAPPLTNSPPRASSRSCVVGASSPWRPTETWAAASRWDRSTVPWARPCYQSPGSRAAALCRSVT